MLPHLEDRDGLLQPAGLVAQGRSSSRGFFHQRSVLLRHLVELAHGDVDLGDAVALLTTWVMTSLPSEKMANTDVQT